MKCLYPVEGNHYKYTHIVGTGGIGSGMFFKLEGSHTLGRNESRTGQLLQFKDYCKLHIITHYIAVLLRAGHNRRFETFPIGKVGNDDTGRRLLDEIKTAGINTEYIETVPGCSTLFSVCFQYPDHTGGNITTSNSASSRVAPEDISGFFQAFGGSGSDELILSVPEVPLDARIRLLEYGRKRGSFNIVSVLSSEVDEFNARNGFEKADLLSVNIDEARSIAHITDEGVLSESMVNECINFLTGINPGMSIIITDGPNGSYSYKDNYLEHTQVPDVDVVATAGAGDTFLAGTIAGLCCGLPLSKGRNDEVFAETPLSSAVELGTLLASLAVTSSDAIHQKADAKLLHEFALQKGIHFSPDFSKIFTDC